MGDYYRAGITSVKFACETELEVQARLDYLLQAREHFTTVSALPTAADEGRPAEEIQERLRAVELQLDLVRFFSERAVVAEADGNTGHAAHLKSTCRLTLFGSETERQQICAELLDNVDDFDGRTALVTEIVDFYNLSLVLVLQMVAPRMAAKGKPEILDDFLRFIGDKVTAEEWDAVVRALVDTLFKLDEGKAADKLVQRMKVWVPFSFCPRVCIALRCAAMLDDSAMLTNSSSRPTYAHRAPLQSDKSKIDAHIACKKLKGAYLVAVRTKNIEEIRHIHQLAVESGNKGVVNICEMFFKSQAKST
jgi:zinc finger FYVE domain-containing protein 26